MPWQTKYTVVFCGTDNKFQVGAHSKVN